MKCPACGLWNRASYPRCFRCGEPLDASAKPYAPPPLETRETIAQLERDKPTVIRYDDFGNESVKMDAPDRLAVEMLSLHDRKRRGEIRQKELMARGAQRGFASAGSSVSSSSRRNRIFQDPAAERKRAREALEGNEPVDYDGFTEAPSYLSLAGDEKGILPEGMRTSSRMAKGPMPRIKRRRFFGGIRFFRYFAIILIILAAGIASYQFLLLPLMANSQTDEAMPQVKISASIVDDMAAHTISIPAPEGAQIYIKELRKSYIVTGGYATFQVVDYFWYELEEHLVDPTMEVTLTPFIRTGSGEQKQIDLVSYTIDIPLSPITLINPDLTYTEVSTPIYNIRFMVIQNSKVFINGEDFSSFVNTQDGLISYNAPIQPFGDNVIQIVVRSQYYRENTVEIIIHRAVQDIPLDLASTLDDESSQQTMSIKATTRAGATVTIISPHQDADFSQLDRTGEFSFKAVFSKIGTNTVEIRADFPDKNPSIVKYDVYYLPPPDVYTKKAWALGDWGYPDLLANINARVDNTQIYVFTGPVKEIISGKPQLVIMDSNDGAGSERLVMVENQTKTPWVLGQRYRIFADVYGIYGNMPRLIARYTYKAAPLTR